MGLFGKKNTREQGNRQRIPTGGQYGNPRYSYYQKRAEIESDDVRRRREERDSENSQSSKRRYVFKGLQRNWVAVLASLVILGSLLYMMTLTNTPTIKIENADAPGSVLLQDEGVYKDAASKLLAGSVLNRFKLTVDSNSLAKQLEDMHPELSGVTVVIPIIGARPTFVIRPINPSFILSSGENSYIVNEFGIAVANINDLENTGELNLTSVVDKSDLPIERNKAALSAEQTEFINTVIAQLKERNIRIQNFVIPVSAYDLEMRLTGKPYFVRFNMLEDARQQVGAYLAVQNEVDKGRQKVNDYIDVRVEERVFIK